MSLSPRALFPTFAERKPAAVAIVASVLVLAVFAIYLPVVQMPFISFDDPDYVWRNPRVVGGLSWDGVGWSLCHSFASNWHPLTWMSHMLDYQIFGMNAGGHHATSVLFHAANTLLLFILLRKMTSALWRSGLVAALFALHPLHLESVAWIAERKDVLSAFFGLLCLWMYAEYAKAKSEIRNPKSETNSKIEIRSKVIFYALALILFALGLMSKPMLVTLPCVMLLLDYWPLERVLAAEGQGQQDGKVGTRSRYLVAEKLPFFALSVISSIVTFLAQNRGGSTWSLESLPLGNRVANAVVSYARYLGKTLWPTRLSIVYPYQEWGALQIGTAAILLIFISFLILRQWRNRSYLVTGWLWFLGMLVPVIGLVQVGAQAMADRYMYLPSIGLFIMFAWGGAEICAREWKQRFIVGLGSMAIMACILVTDRELACWQSSETLFRHALAVTKKNYIAYNNLGFHYGQAGDLKQAEKCYRAAVEINRKSKYGWGDLAVILAMQKRTAEALEAYERALEISPDYAPAHVNLANLLIFEGKTNDAIAHFEEAIRINPELAEARQNFAAILTEQGELNRASDEYRAALQLRPYNPYIHSDYGRMLLKQGKLDEAATEYKIAISLDPQLRLALYGLGDVLLACGEIPVAVDRFSRVVKLAPEDPEAHYRLALALTRQGNIKEAVEHYRRGLKKIEDSPEALNNLAWILATNPDAEVRNGAEAVKFAQKACELTGYKKAVFVGTLAAAYAEANRFSEALETAEKARSLAEAANETEIADRNLKLMELYRAQKPCRDVP